jgi:L-ascorbate metabolism protein UlaG (beta-lactamase superfamily)
MRRLAVPLALALLAAAFPVGRICIPSYAADDKPEEKKTDEDKGKLVIRWHGQSFFEITTSKGTKVIIDPHTIEAYRMSLNEEIIDADLVLISHPHTDHSDMKALKGYKDPKKFKQIWGVKQDTRDWNLVKEEFRDVKVQVVATYHDKDNGMKRGKNGVFVIEVDGLRIVHLGDLGHELSPAQVRRIKAMASDDDPGKPVDILMIPIGGIFTLNGLDAMKVVEQLNPTRHIIPMHYGTLVFDWALDLKKSHFLDDISPDRVVKMKTNKLVIDPKEPAPKEASFTIMHYFEK